MVRTILRVIGPNCSKYMRVAYRAGSNVTTCVISPFPLPHLAVNRRTAKRSRTVRDIYFGCRSHDITVDDVMFSQYPISTTATNKIDSTTPTLIKAGSWSWINRRCSTVICRSHILACVVFLSLGWRILRSRYSQLRNGNRSDQSTLHSERPTANVAIYLSGACDPVCYITPLSRRYIVRMVDYGMVLEKILSIFCPRL